jgi:hypothetical protein
MPYVQRKADAAIDEAPAGEGASSSSKGARRGKYIDVDQISTSVSIAPVGPGAAAGFGHCLPAIRTPTSMPEIFDRGGKWKPEGSFVFVRIQPKVRFPGDKTKISSATDGKITPENRQAVADDLTPSEQGRAPRHKYYSPKLVVQHEMVHANDYESAAEPIIAKRKAELADKSCNDKHAVVAALDEMAAFIRGDLVEHYAGAGIRTNAAALKIPDMATYLARPGERLAYDDGKPAYQALADAIRKG